MKISPSSLKRAKCLRRYVAEKHGGYSDPGGKAANFGTQVHKVGEGWFEGKDPDPATKQGRLFAEFIPHIPARDLTSERYIKFTADGVEFHGYIDFSGWAGGKLYTGDFKTSSKPWEYGLTTDELMYADGQVNIYSLSNMIDYGADSTEALWLYADTSKSRFAFPAQVTISYARAEDFLADYALPVARSMIEATDSFKQLVDSDTSDRVKLSVINSIPCDPEECGWRTYNCGFRAHCECFGQTDFLIPEELGMEDLTLEQIIERRNAARAADAAKAAVPVETDALPPEHVEALPEAVAQRDLPPEQQDLGRKANEKEAKAAGKRAPKVKSESAPVAKPPEPEPTTADLQSAILKLNEVMAAAGLKGSLNLDLGSPTP